MSALRTPWLRLSAVLCVLLFALSAQAAVRMAGAPSGWEEGSPDAVARAEGWADALGGSVDDVFSTRSEDRFAETLALLSLPVAMSPGAELNPERALEEAVGSLFETAPTSPRFLEGTDGAPIVTGIWTEDGIVYEVAVVSGGPGQGVVFLAVRESERSLYAKIFDEAVESIEGAAPPLSPFDVGPWRTGSLVCWLLVLVVGWLVIAKTAVAEDGAAAVGRSVAVLCILLAVVAGSVVYMILIDEAGPLRLANLTRSRVALEVTGAGSLAALIAWFIGAFRDGTVRRVESAPAGRGTFSGSARTLGPNIVPPNRPAVLTDPGHGMGEAELVKADGEAMRQPLATLVGAPSLASAGSDDAFDKVWAEAQAAAEAAVDEENGASDDTLPAESDPGSDAPTRAPVVVESTVVGPAPAPATPAPKPKTKTQALQFPPPMSDDS